MTPTINIRELGPDHLGLLDRARARADRAHLALRAAGDPDHQMLLLGEPTSAVFAHDGANTSPGDDGLAAFFDSAEGIARRLRHLERVAPPADGSALRALEVLGEPPPLRGYRAFVVGGAGAVRVADIEPTTVRVTNRRASIELGADDVAHRAALDATWGDLWLSYGGAVGVGHFYDCALVFETDGPLSFQGASADPCAHDGHLALLFNADEMASSFRALAAEAPTRDGSEHLALETLGAPIPPRHIKIYIHTAGVVRTVLRAMPTMGLRRGAA